MELSLLRPKLCSFRAGGVMVWNRFEPGSSTGNALSVVAQSSALVRPIQLYVLTVIQLDIVNC